MARMDRLYTNPRSKRAGEQTADKGDRRTMDKEIEDGPNRVELKGEYESIGREGRQAGDKEAIDAEDKNRVDKDLDEWIKSGKKGPAPSFKNAPADKKDGDGYEIWRRRKGEVPTS